jgi:hypothetical protein
MNVTKHKQLVLSNVSSLTQCKLNPYRCTGKYASNADIVINTVGTKWNNYET